MVSETIEDAITIAFTGGYWNRPTQRGVIKCVTAGSIVIEYPSGVTETIAMTAGQETRRSPLRVVQAGTTGTYIFLV